MSTTLHDSDAGINSLPQCGFGEEINFDKLIHSNRFLFRVYTPKERSPFADDSEPFFVAPRFNELVSRSPLDLPEIKFPETMVGTYAEVARHMDWTTKSSSCYLSASFSFGWAIWEAVKRYHVGVKKDVQIAIIDTQALGGRAATAVQLLMKSNPQQRDEQFWKWHRFCQDSQTVLIYGMVPHEAVLASVPLLQILRKMPSYFLREDIQVIDGNPLNLVSWNYASRKLSYRHFCQEMTSTFKNHPEEVRLRDATSGAVRLALSFLRPFFHNLIQDDFNTAISYLRTLAASISQWPGDGFVTSHPEVKQIVDSMVLALGEELREKYSLRRTGEVTRLQLVIQDLVQSLEAGKNVGLYDIEEVELDSEGDFETHLEESDEPTLVSSDPITKEETLAERRTSLKLSVTVLPDIPPVSFKTPITPPESPRHSLTLPTITVPLGDHISRQLVFKPLLSDPQSSVETSISPKTAPTSPASPPPTPPPRSPVFSAPLPLLQDLIDTIAEEDEEPPTDMQEAELEAVVEATLEREILGQQPFVRHIAYEDDERTEHGDDELDVSASWLHVSSPSLSRRSSIFSVDTLIDPMELPMPKRWSFSHSRTNSYNLFTPLSPPSSSRPSRTVSFSEPTKGFFPFPAVIPLDPCTIPLPPSPEASVRSLSPSPVVSPSISRSDTLSSLSSTSSESESTSSVPSSPGPIPHIQLPVNPHTSIITPKRMISLLTPLPRLDDEDEPTTASSRSTGVVATTASYVVSGFLIGTFITFFLFSTQRRTMLYVT